MQVDDFKAALIGRWHGTKQLYMQPPPARPLTSESTLTVTPAAGGFLKFNYEWTFEGEAQSGLLLAGADEQNAATAAWVDSFHMSSKIMFCTGTATGGSVEVRGSYEAPPGPNWGWRIAIRSTSPAELQILMHNISPDGQEDLAVQADFTRS